MIARIARLYRHLFRRSPALDEHPLDWKITQLRHPLDEQEYVEAFGLTLAGYPAMVTEHDDGAKSITLLDDADHPTFLENESSSTFAPKES